MLKLYDYYRSSACFRVRIALQLKNIPYEKITIDLRANGGEQHSPEYKKINPQSLLPSLQDGNKIVTQSLAIIEYLNDIHPEPALLPKDPYEKALVRSVALTIAADTHPLNNSGVLNYLSNEFKITEAQKTAWYHQWLRKNFNALETKLASNYQQGNFCFGDQITLADVCLAPQIFNARRFAFDMTNYPTLVKLEEIYKKHPAFVKAWPQEEAVKEG